MTRDPIPENPPGPVLVGVDESPRARDAVAFGEALAAALQAPLLLVCGSGGSGPLASVVLGSHSNHLAHAARCPLVVVPRGTAVPTLGGAALAALSSSD